jgi:predicted RNA methylase
MNGSQNKTNPAEKLVELALALMRPMVGAGSKVLVLCAGVGSEIIASAMLGTSVVGVEQHPGMVVAILQR